MKRMCIYPWMLMFSMLLVACIGANVAPMSLQQQLASAELSLAGLVRAHTSLIQTGRITRNVDAQLSEQEDNAKAALDMSRFYLKIGDVKNAQSQYEAMDKLLTAISARIAELEKQKQEKGVPS